MKRSAFLTASAAALLTPAQAFASGAWAALRDIETSTGGRLGVAIVDLETGRRIGYRDRERFPMCSTFKVLLVAAVSSKIPDLSRSVAYGRGDLLAYAPVTRRNVSSGHMSIRDLCEAAIVYSDNTAANLLLAQIGGPSAVTHYARSIGDAITRLDRTEPALNQGSPGDPRDTTTPSAMARDLAAIARNAQIVSWMRACRTGSTLLRAGLPPGWTVGDKTGMGGAENRFGDSDTRNDIAIVWRGRRAPLIITAYLTGAAVHAAQRDAAIASVGRLAAREFVEILPIRTE